MEIVQYQLIDHVAFLTIESGKVNSLGYDLRSALYNQIQLAIEDSAVEKIVLQGNGKFFSAGADIYEFNTPKATQEPLLPQLITLIMNSPKVIVAAVDGIAFGGGFELALAAHYRVGFSSSQFRLPEVNLGLIPGAGGTQLLPRVIGIGLAAEMIVQAKLIRGRKAFELGIVDQFFETYDSTALLNFVREQSLPTRDIEKPVSLTDSDREKITEIGHWISKRKRGYDAEKYALKSVENSALLPFSKGVQAEREAFLKLLSGTQFSALRHLFASERGLYPQLAPDQYRDVRTASVIGGGLMGRGICMSLVNAGIPTTIVEQNSEALEKTIVEIESTYTKMVERGRVSDTAKDQALSLITGAIDYHSIRDVDIVIEAVYEDMDLKKSIFRELDEICDEDTILVSNTSRLDINELASVTKRESQFLGMHFFSPAHIMKLVEIVRGNKTSQYALNTIIQLSKKMRKLGVVVGVCEGFVGNRMLTTYRNEALFVLEEGAKVGEVDQALYDFGMAMGPFTMTDMAGLDISWAARKRVQASGVVSPYRDSVIGDRLCELGRFGQKTSAGYYRYDAGSYRPIEDPIVEEVIESCAVEKGITRHSWTADEIVERTIFALINEGFKLLEEGIVDHSSAIDLVYIHGYGFPAYRGGPMFYADTIGLPSVLTKITEFSQKYGEHWKPAQLLVELASKNEAVTAFRKENK